MSPTRPLLRAGETVDRGSSSGPRVRGVHPGSLRRACPRGQGPRRPHSRVLSRSVELGGQRTEAQRVREIAHLLGPRGQSLPSRSLSPGPSCCCSCHGNQDPRLSCPPTPSKLGRARRRVGEVGRTYSRADCAQFGPLEHSPPREAERNPRAQPVATQ